MTMEYKGFTVTKRTYTGNTIWSALRPRVYVTGRNTTFGDVVASARTAEALYRNVDVYLAKQCEAYFEKQRKGVLCDDWAATVPQPLTLHPSGQAYGMLMPMLTPVQMSNAPLNAKASQA